MHYLRWDRRSTVSPAGKLSIAGGVASLIIGLLCLTQELHAVNVKDFGAKGDGKSDDTVAIQKAIDAASAQADAGLIRIAPHIKGGVRGGSGIGESSTPQIIIPPGTYKLSNTLIGSRLTMLKGIGRPTLLMTSSEKDILYFNRGRRVRVENIRFKGGNCQVRLWTGNGDMSFGLFEKCEFIDGIKAVHTDSLARMIPGKPISPYPKPIPPYTVTREDGKVILTNRNTDNLKWMYNSTILKMYECKFKNCKRAVWAQVDYTIMDKCEIETSPEMEGAAIFLRGLARISDLHGFARVNPKLRQYWIETDEDSTLDFKVGLVKYGSTGTIALRRLNLDTDGRGMCVVRSNTVPHKSPRSLLIYDSVVKASGCPEGGIVSLAPQTMPNLLVMRNVKERGEKPVLAIACEATPDIWLPAKVRHNKRTNIEDNFCFVISDCPPPIDCLLPKAFMPFLEKDSVSKMAKIAAMDIVFEPKRLEELESPVLNAAEFPLKAGLKEDNSEVLSKIFAAAQKRKCKTVIFPGKNYLVGKTVSLPPEITIAGEGMVLFRAAPGVSEIFKADDTRRIVFRNTKFVDGNFAVKTNTPIETKAFVGFDYCAFLGQRETAITAMAGSSKNKLKLYVRNCLFRCKKGINTNASGSYLDTLWLHNFPQIDHEAFVSNRGGNMHAIACLAVPTIRDPQKWKKLLPSDFGDDIRWFDNWGNLHLEDGRFGGESQGSCTVFQRGDGLLDMEGGYSKFYNPYTRRCIVYFEKKPRQAILRDVLVTPLRRPATSTIWRSSFSNEKFAPVMSGIVFKY